VRKNCNTRGNTTPYLGLRLLRTEHKGRSATIDPHAPCWVTLKYGGYWRRIRLCENEEKAIETMVSIATELRRAADLS